MSTSQWHSVAVLHDIPQRGSRQIDHGVHRIALFRTASNSVYALEDSCPHDAGPLSEGIVHDNCVTCPLHNWIISLETGAAQGADVGGTRTYPVKMDGESVLVHLPAIGE